MIRPARGSAKPSTRQSDTTPTNPTTARDRMLGETIRTPKRQRWYPQPPFRRTSLKRGCAARMKQPTKKPADDGDHRRVWGAFNGGSPGETSLRFGNAREEDGFRSVSNSNRLGKETRRQCGSPTGRLSIPDMDEDADRYASRLIMRGQRQSSCQKRAPPRARRCKVDVTLPSGRPSGPIMHSGG